MKSTLLFGSMAAVVLMVLASFGTVVGSENIIEGLELKKEQNIQKIGHMEDSLKIDINELANPGEVESTFFFLACFLYLIGRAFFGLVNFLHILAFGYPAFPMP